MHNKSKVLLLKYGEIVLKGLNRKSFEKLLGENIINALRNYKNKSGRKDLFFKIEREQSIMTVRCEDINFDIEDIIPVLTKVFGIVAVNPAVEIAGKNIEKIKETALEYISPMLEGKKSFGVFAKRSDKSFPLKSPEIALQVGDILFENNKNIKVDLKNPEVWVAVEVRNNGVFMHAEKHRGAGGMPSGSNGRGLLLLSGGIDSPVAGYMTARRGMKISALHFTSEPYTSERSREKTIKLAGILSEYCGEIKFYSVCLTEIQESIRKYCREDYAVILLRRFMVRIAGIIAGEDKYNYDCLITGESLGQVASQTIEAVKVIYDGINMPVFRPCIGLDKYQIIEMAEKIGTYETSVEPYDDCCALFTPRHPVTKPKLGRVLGEENRIEDIQGLIDRAVAEIRCEIL
ncbi:MAG: tRNA 4-thiouridine(8) synthase ThiI [Oscillospiraceae bacterium]|nr:tRNA 4-thiouridine(8) synthase ThiI [Oscillospiraceae bacterium]